MSNTEIVYAQKNLFHNVIVYRHFFKSLVQLRMCGCDDPVTVELEWFDKNVSVPDHYYWGWFDLQENKFSCSLTKPVQSLFKMQFAYGPEVEEQRGKGKIVRVKVTKIGEVK